MHAYNKMSKVDIILFYTKKYEFMHYCVFSQLKKNRYKRFLKPSTKTFRPRKHTQYRNDIKSN